MKKITKKIALSLALLVAALALLSYAEPVQAGSILRTWISGTGSDSNTSNDCQPLFPCKSFGEGIFETVQGGELNCLGPTEPGTSGETPLNITTAITIDCHGTFGGILATSGQDGFVINAPGAVVTLRGLNLDGNSSYNGGTNAGNVGIRIESAAVVNIEDCVIENFAASGIVDQRSSGSAQLFVRNTVVRNNGNITAGNGGIDIVPGSGATLQVVIDRSQISANNFGIGADGRQGGTIRATISDSVVSGNRANGISAISSGASVALLLDQAKVTANGVGLYASGSNAAMAARNTSVFNNTTGLEAVSGGKLLTYGNNSVTGNPTEGAFTGTAGLQ